VTARRRFDIREKAGVVFTILAAWLGVNLAVAILVNLPRAGRASTLEESTQLFDGKLSERRTKVMAIRTEYERIMDGLRKLETFYEDVLSTKKERMTAVQREIRAIAARFHIKPEAIRYNRQFFESDQIVKFWAILPLTGSYENLRAFIDAVENSENFLTIESIGLSDSKEGGVILALDITLATFFFDPDLSEASASVPRST
jgi:Tfp pilus assembly protein PilO